MPNAKTNQIPTDFELMLLRQLWSNSPLSAREIHDASVEETNWSYSATRATLDRMVAKGFLKTKLVHGVKTFQPKQAKLETMARLISRFSKTILHTDGPLPVAAFSQSKLLNKQEITDLEELLEKLDADQKGGSQ